MKQLIFGLAIAALAFTACNDNASDKKEDHSNHNTTANGETTAPDSSTQTAGKSAANFDAIFTGYLALKNALVADDAKAAAEAAKKMNAVLKGIDTTSIPADKLRQYQDVAEDALEHTEHIGDNAGNIKHEREHFAVLSEDVFHIAKGFGSGQTLYKDFCPMYNNKKGAFWLSETKEIKNPFYGKEMLTCGEVQEELK